MKRISLFLLLAPVVLLIGCGPDAQRDSAVQNDVIKNESEAAVQPTEEPDQAQLDMTKSEMAKPEIANLELNESEIAKPEINEPEMIKPDAAPDSPAEVVFGDQFPEVLAVKVSGGQDNRWRFNVTLSSTYDTPDRYADAWRVLNDQDNELRIRLLGHDHANEQPFTRSGTFEIPEGTQTVFVEGRDQDNGWSGQRFEFKMP